MKKRFIKILLLILFFAYPSFCFAGKYVKSKIEIEGMSVGDSLLNYLSKEQIQKFSQSDIYKFREDEYKDNDLYNYITVGFSHRSFKIYDVVQIHIKPDDPEYIIHSMSGNIYINRMSECLLKQTEIVKELTEILKDVKIKDGPYTKKHNADNSGKSINTSVDFLLNNGGYVFVDCMDWSDEMPHKDMLMLGISNKEFAIWFHPKN